MELPWALAAAALLWVGVHVGIAGTALRAAIAGRVGEAAFRIGFSLLSVVAITLLVMAWQAAPTTPLWQAPGWLRWLLAVLMLPAFLLFAASLRGNPTAAGGDGALAQEPRGIQRVTRHPMLWSFSLWAGVHMLGNGDSASLVFFGAFLVTSLVGMPSIDAKIAARAPAAWEPFAARTSIIPFGASRLRPARMAPGEIGWIAPLAALVAWAALLHLHARLFGVPAVLPG